MQTMVQDCRKIFTVPSFVIILLGEIIMAIGGSGAGYQIMYFEVRRQPLRCAFAALICLPRRHVVALHATLRRTHLLKSCHCANFTQNDLAL